LNRRALHFASLACAFAVVALLVGSCGARNSLRTAAAGCPPAPLAAETPQGACTGGTERTYAAPRGVLADWFDPVNVMTCDCNAGKWQCAQTGIACAGNCQTPVCPFPLPIGKACNEAENSECLLPAGSAESPTRDMACACDEPGPIWRCIAR